MYPGWDRKIKSMAGRRRLLAVGVEIHRLVRERGEEDPYGNV